MSTGNCVIWKTLQVVACVMLIGSCGEPVAGQDQRSRSQEPEVQSMAARELLRAVGVEEVTQENLNAACNDLIQRRDARLVPYLEERFEQSERYGTKMHAAARLVYLGVDDPRYWEYVHAEALAAISSGIPNPSDPDLPVGTESNEELPEFQLWREEHGLTLAEAMELQDRYYGAIFELGATKDPRAVDLAIQGLDARNAMIVLLSVRSLASLQDRRAIEPIIAALEKQPKSVARSGAMSLLFFDTPRAQSAAARFIGDAQMYEEVRSVVEKHGVETLFGY